MPVSNLFVNKLIMINLNQQVETIEEQNLVNQTEISSVSSSKTSDIKDTKHFKLKKDWSSVRDVREGAEGTQVFGTRTLDSKDNVWNHNAWLVNHFFTF